jgi:hypothetical protein
VNSTADPGLPKLNAWSLIGMFPVVVELPNVHPGACTSPRVIRVIAVPSAFTSNSTAPPPAWWVPVYVAGKLWFAWAAGAHTKTAASAAGTARWRTRDIANPRAILRPP